MSSIELFTVNLIIDKQLIIFEVVIVKNSRYLKNVEIHSKNLELSEKVLVKKCNFTIKDNENFT